MATKKTTLTNPVPKTLTSRKTGMPTMAEEAGGTKRIPTHLG
jgi:hypothetical protein